MEKIKKQLINGLPDSRIIQVAVKLVVESDNGLEIELKNRYPGIGGNDSDIVIDREIDYGSIHELVNEITNKKIKVTSKVFPGTEIRELLSKI